MCSFQYPSLIANRTGMSGTRSTTRSWGRQPRTPLLPGRNTTGALVSRAIIAGIWVAFFQRVPAIIVRTGSGTTVDLDLSDPKHPKSCIRWSDGDTTGADCDHSRKKVLQHRYVTVEIGAGRCDVTKYGAVGDGKTDDVRVQQQPAPGLFLSSDHEVVATGRRVRFRKRSTRVQSKAAGW